MLFLITFWKQCKQVCTYVYGCTTEYFCFSFWANVFVFTEIGVNIKFINGHTIITQWKTCKGVLLNGININLHEMKVSLFFVENGISYTLQLSFISRKSNGFSRKKEVYSFVINLLHWAL